MNDHRNEFSGGSGVLVDYPDLFPKMYSIARICLIIAFIATAALMLVVENSLWPILWSLYFLSAFFSKFYTASPVKLAYRGVGEISVWFAFGPMAILVAAVSQNVGFHPLIITAMPITGISTLSILLLGQLIDLEADKAGGKLGAAARKGPAFTAFLYVTVQLLLVLNVLILSLYFVSGGWIILISLIPYLLLLPGISRIVLREYGHPEKLKPAAKKNVKLHLLFALLFSLGIGLSLWCD
jgi:1,4-dihydroxy-2-naphthoate octaprenyltransferase